MAKKKKAAGGFAVPGDPGTEEARQDCREAVWREFFSATLTGSITGRQYFRNKGEVKRITTEAAGFADAALKEWENRFGN